jgi:hypothetical protein
MKNKKEDILSDPRIDILIIKKNRIQENDVQALRDERADFSYGPDYRNDKKYVRTGKKRPRRLIALNFALLGVVALIYGVLSSQHRASSVIGMFQAALDASIDNDQLRVVLEVKKIKTVSTDIENEIKVKFYQSKSESNITDFLPSKIGQIIFITATLPYENSTDYVFAEISINKLKIVLSRKPK